jgi:PilZ domain
MFSDMNETMADNQHRMMRSNPRYPFFADAEVTLRDGSSVVAQLEQLSARGCYIDALEPIPIRTKMRLRISDGMSSCELQGQIIYMHSGGGLGIWGMGVRFEDLNPEQHSTLESWLRSLAKNPRNVKAIPNA